MGAEEDVCKEGVQMLRAQGLDEMADELAAKRQQAKQGRDELQAMIMERALME